LGQRIKIKGFSAILRLARQIRPWKRWRYAVRPGNNGDFQDILDALALGPHARQPASLLPALPPRVAGLLNKELRVGRCQTQPTVKKF